MNITLRENEQVCANCKHFYQHYGRWAYGGTIQYFEINSGHCGTPRLKERKPGTQGCGYWEDKANTDLSHVG